jgi:hypothetical protein
MSRLKFVLLSMFAVLAVGAFASASASAEDSCTTGTKSLFCFHTNKPIHSEEVLGTSGVSKLEGKVGGAALKVECADDKFTGLLELLGASKGLIEFLTCSVTEPGSCTVNQPIFAQFTDQLSSGVMPATDLFTGSAGAGEEFTTLTIAGTGCSVPGKYQVTGLQTVELPKGEESLVNHEVVAKKAGSKLKLGVETASFSSTAIVHLASGLAWLVMLGT